MSLHGTTKAIYQLSAVSGAAILPENVPDGVKSNVKELGDQKGMMAHGSLSHAWVFFCRDPLRRSEVEKPTIFQV